MENGFYEKVLTQAAKEEIEKLGELALFLPETFQKENGSIYLHRFASQLLFRAFQQINDSAEEIARPRLIELSNRMVEMIATFLEDQSLKSQQIREEGQIVKALFNRQDANFADLKEHLKEVFPFTGLSESELFTGSKAGIAMDGELRKEMRSCDEVCWLVSFIKFEGVRLFEQTFRILENQGVPVRIICTVYMGATDLKAIDFLSQFSNVQIRISYNSKHERLHAKAYLFRRNSGFDTGYVGSSNLSRSALTKGLEWNLKITRQEIPHVLDKCLKTFETYWFDPEFELYDPFKDRPKLEAALGYAQHPNQDLDEKFYSFFEIRPYNFQIEILNKLKEARLKGQNKNLLVAATGTGKTVMAAFDFRNFRKTNPQARFLFVAHREEILRQSRATFRHILKDSEFGSLWFASEKPKEFHQLFVSVQTLRSQLPRLALGKNYFDYIVVDEVHHAAAFSYQQLFEFLEPQLLLGLTATPERYDGQDISRYFGHEISAEIRLPEAMARGLLCPFQYFAISDETDISQVSWRRGRYDSLELDKVFSEDSRRAKSILRNCEKYLKDFRQTKAVGFCVSQRHARFMRDSFLHWGMKAELLTSESGSSRNEIIQKFRRGEVNYLFVVDIFNEGVDIPEIDTLLFLRPSESLTVFLQQLGRGLRLSEGKEYLTVLDFVGQVRQEYSFEHRFRALIGKTRSRIKDEIEQDFPHLPLGCSIVLERMAKEIVLKNLSKHLGGGINKILQAIRRFKSEYEGEIYLQRFSELTEISLHQIYNPRFLFFELLAKAENKTVERKPIYEKLAFCMAETWLSTESASYFGFLQRQVSQGFRVAQNVVEERWLLMLYTDIFRAAPQLYDFPTLAAYFGELFDDDLLCKEMLEYLQLRLEQLETTEQEIFLPFHSALRLHGRYTRSQIFSALPLNNLSKLVPSREGVYRAQNLNTELFFVTLNKGEGSFHASIAYDDYFLNEELFHWQSQNSTASESKSGKAYIEQEFNQRTFLLFVRENKTDENGITMGFRFCGPLRYIRHEGSQPMSITWKMEYAPPPDLLSTGIKLAAG